MANSALLVALLFLACACARGIGRPMASATLSEARLVLIRIDNQGAGVVRLHTGHHNARYVFKKTNVTLYLLPSTVSEVLRLARPELDSMPPRDTLRAPDLPPLDSLQELIPRDTLTSLAPYQGLLNWLMH